jgi:hypothetical protein
MFPKLQDLQDLCKTSARPTTVVFSASYCAILATARPARPLKAKKQDTHGRRRTQQTLGY